MPTDPPLQPGIDYYMEHGFLVFTAAYHLRRGYCCESGCRHCPYGERSSDADPTGDESESATN